MPAIIISHRDGPDGDVAQFLAALIRSVFREDAVAVGSDSGLPDDGVALVVVIGAGWRGDAVAWMHDDADPDVRAIHAAVESDRWLLPVLVDDAVLADNWPEALYPLSRRVPFRVQSQNPEPGAMRLLRTLDELVVDPSVRRGAEDATDSDSKPVETVMLAPSGTDTASFTRDALRPVGVEALTRVRLDLHVGPGAEYGVVCAVSAREAVTVIGKDATLSWVKVEYGDETGWLPRSRVKMPHGVMARIPLVTA
jgi:hypothetical protein